MARRKGPQEKDVVERFERMSKPDAMHRELCDQVVYLRQQMALLTRDLNRCHQERLLALNHKLRND